MLLLTGCGRGAPDGQVAARVDGVEITDRELLGEAAVNGADLSRPQVRSALLDRLIDRKLLARAGQAALADRIPATQIQARRAHDEVLARAYASRIAAGIAPPDAAEIDAFMRRNPHRFGARATYLLDRLRVARTDASGIEDLPSDAAGRTLDRNGTAFRRQLVLIDSDTLNGAAQARLAALTSGQSLRSTAGADFVIDTLVLAKRVVEPLAAQRARAGVALTQMRSTAAIDSAIWLLRANADIVIRSQDAEPER